MKHYLIIFLPIISILTLTSCGKSFYYVKNDINIKHDIINRNITESFKTDSTSKVFIRRLYVNKSETNLYNEITIDDSKDNKLIEVQYLIFNGNKVLYISTIPSKYIYDKTQQYLLKKEGGKISYPNAFFFNSFYFGTVKSSDNKTIKIEFKKKKKIINWNFEINIDSKRNCNAYNLLSIEEFKSNNANKRKSIVINESVKNEIYFSNSYEFIGNPNNYFKYLSFKVPYSKCEMELADKMEEKLREKDSIIKYYADKYKETLKQKISFPIAYEILIIYKDSTKSKVKKLIIPFENDFKSIKFKCNRVKYITSLN
ncbi:hypothetical protein [Flavobacterium filum]|uniref:hypothetical protein n=1 Tax=Flavobacterium filum TaxID=370974 RepID=UPI00041D14EB|nr:hypothetical protein [Flavobacterium filum]